MQSDFNNYAETRAPNERISNDFNDLLLNSTDEEKADFLHRLHLKGETPEEVATLALLLRKKSTLSPVPGTSDIVGTGGDGMNTINVSTAASMVLSSMGIRVAKHGNFGATSNKGSADFLKSIGYIFEMSQAEMEERLKDNSFAFVLAPMYNDNFAKFAKARKSLGHKTVFNYLGPLTNPADPSVMMLGVTEKKISNLYTTYLLLNSKSGCVVFSDDGMDEISPNFPSNITYVKSGTVEETKFYPESVLPVKIKLDDISRIEPEESFKLTNAGLDGSNNHSASFIALNAAMALCINNKFESPEEAYKESLKLLKTGYVKEHVDRIVKGRT